MDGSTASRSPLNAEEAIWLAEALSAQLEGIRTSLGYRSMFSALYNRKLVRKMELLDRVRAEYLDIAAECRRKSQEEQAKYV